MTDTQTRKTYFPIVDFWRGFAAISVIMYHLIEHFKWTNYPTDGIAVWFRIGWMSVDFFFVISGFVIGLSAFSGIEKHNEKFKRNFIINRFVRIAPLYYLTILAFVFFITPSLLFERAIQNFALHSFFIHNLLPWSHGAINGSNWSIGVEMQFYLLILLTAPLLLKTKWQYSLIVFVSITWLYRFAIYSYVPLDDVTGPFVRFVYATQLPGMLDEFAFGIILAKFIRSDKGQRLITSKNKAIKIAMLLSTIALGLVLSKIFWANSDYWQNPWMVIFFRTGLGLFFTILLLTSFFIPENIVKSYAMKPFLYLGTISYGLYLWHLPVMLSLHELTWLSASRAVMPVLIGTILFASISWHYFEKPLLEKYARK